MNKKLPPEEKKERRRADSLRRYYQNQDKNKQRFKDYYENNKERFKEKYLKNLYGLSIDAFNSLLAGQGGVCAICGSTNWLGPHGSPSVDHDHTTGKIRGILCHNCNVAIGFIQDDPKIALSMADYLEKNK